MVNNKYIMSFTAGALLYHETIIVAKLIVEIGNWDEVRDKILADNALQMRTPNSSKRIYREIAPRLKQLTPSEFELLQNGSYREQHYLLWLAVCKRYRFIYDFAVEILREKFLKLDFELTNNEYEVFFDTKAEWHPEVERVAKSTRIKQRQIVFKMMRDAELLSADNLIIPALLSPRLKETIASDDPGHFSIFPISDLDVKP
jgi:hypothetical protein